jgi:predicted transcriptional regulator of viral defense system
MLRKQPGLPIREIAKAIYGRDDDKAYNAARTLVDSLHSQKRLRRIGRGQYEVADKTPST